MSAILTSEFRGRFYINLLLIFLFIVICEKIIKRIALKLQVNVIKLKFNMLKSCIIKCSANKDKYQPRLSSHRPQQPSNQQFNVIRRVYQQDALNQDADYHLPKHTIKGKCKKVIKSIGIIDCLLNTIPIIKWLPKYKFKEYLVGDLVAGITTAVMHIPQGMAYALLTGAPPIVGLYMAFFPVLIYVLLGTSPDASLGTFAVGCLMAGKVVREHAVDTETHVAKYTPIEVISALSFMVGLTQVIMWIFRLGVMAALLSEPLVSGFTTGASFHVLASQLKDLFGIKLPPLPSNFIIISTVIEVCKNLPGTNWAAFIISFITCLLLSLNNEFLKPWISKRSRIPLPAELILIVAGTLASTYMDLKENYNIKLVGTIPSGLPVPSLPALDLAQSIIVDVLSQTMVTYTITLSVSLIFAARKKYEIDANQELLALGAGNIFGSFFSCSPMCASLSRSFIQFTAGSRTLIASLVSASGVLCVLLFFGPFFEKLPRCVLASIVVVSLKALFTQVVELKKFWNLSKLDAAVWLVTFLVTALVNIDIGLGAGLLASVGALFVRSQKPYTCLLGRVMDTELYMDIKRYRTAKELPSIKIFHYCGGLNFATKNQFRSTLLRKIGCYGDPLGNSNQWDTEFSNKIKCVIIDATALSYVDGPGIKALIAVKQELASYDVTTLLAGANAPVLEMIERFNSLEDKERLVLLTFPTVHDAVVYFCNPLGTNHKPKTTPTSSDGVIDMPTQNNY